MGYHPAPPAGIEPLGHADDMAAGHEVPAGRDKKGRDEQMAGL